MKINHLAQALSISVLFCFHHFSTDAITISTGERSSNQTKVKACSSLNKFQYKCDPLIIDSVTQQPSTCQPDNSVIVTCYAVPGVHCFGQAKGTSSFNLTTENACYYGSHISHSTALIFSIFFGFLGIDRIYLGYYAIGLFKMFSLGGLFIFWLADVVLIALQVVTPADGTQYFMPYYGPRSYAVRFSSETTNYTILDCADC